MQPGSSATPNWKNRRVCILNLLVLMYFSLKTLTLHSNQLADLPAEFSQLQALTDLTLEENPLSPALLSAYSQVTPLGCLQYINIIYIYIS